MCQEPGPQAPTARGDEQYRHHHDEANNPDSGGQRENRQGFGAIDELLTTRHNRWHKVQHRKGKEANGEEPSQYHLAYFGFALYKGCDHDSQCGAARQDKDMFKYRCDNAENALYHETTTGQQQQVGDTSDQYPGHHESGQRGGMRPKPALNELAAGVITKSHGGS